MDRAERHAALAAPARLTRRLLLFKQLVDLAEVMAAFGDATLLGHLLGQVHETQHSLSHQPIPVLSWLAEL